MAEEHFDLAIIGGGVLEDGAAGRAGSEGAGAFSLGVTGFGRAMTPVEDVLVSPGPSLRLAFLRRTLTFCESGAVPVVDELSRL